MFLEFSAGHWLSLNAARFPDGEKAGWWIKAVQLGHESRGLLLRGPGSPVRLWRA